MDSSKNINVDLGFPLEPIFTNGLAFYQALIESTRRRKPSIVSISTYNTSINEGMTESVLETLTSLCEISTSVHLLVGINSFHLKLFTIRATLKRYTQVLPKLRVRELQGVHMKCFLTSTCGYAGSLNLIHPTLDDLMVRLTTHQRLLVQAYFDRLWAKATIPSYALTQSKT